MTEWVSLQTGARVAAAFADGDVKTDSRNLPQRVINS